MLEQEVKELIIDVLQLEDISPKDIDTDAPLFVDGLGLDSIDALELGVAVQKKYQVKLDASNSSNKPENPPSCALAKPVKARRNSLRSRR